MNMEMRKAARQMRREDVDYMRQKLLHKTGPKNRLKNPSEKAPENPSAEASNNDAAERTRQYVKRDWPETGTMLYADYYGTRYEAVVVEANKKLKSGRQIKLLSGTVSGHLCDSFSEAMLLATESQRRKQGLRRKGVSNGWDFWQWTGKA